MGISLGSTAISNIKLGDSQVYKVYQGSDTVWDSGVTPPPTQIRALKFTSTGAQTLGVDSSVLGTITPSFEYSTDGTTWSTWNLANTLPFGNGTDLYVRGSNTFLAKSGSNYTKFQFSTNSPVVCSGNVMHLFDYTQDLAAFPDESGTSRGIKCMFQDCTALTTAPSLPATTLAQYCYYCTFQDCTALTTAPSLPATTLAAYCYRQMFYGCTSLVSPSSLPATATVQACYQDMFNGCVNLSSLPLVDATATGYCCVQMFCNCSKIKMSATQTGEYTNAYTFRFTPDNSTCGDMFLATGGTFVGTPSQRTYYTSNAIVS